MAADNNSKYYNVKKGVVFILLAGVGFSLMTLFVRLSGDLPTFEKAFFRNFIAAIISLGILIKKKELGELNVSRENRWPLLIRCMSGTAGLLFNFWAIDHIGLADSNMLNKMSPFFSIIFCIFILKDIPKPADIACVVIALIGACFVVKPGSSLFQPAAVIGLLGGMGAGLSYTYVRKLGMHGVKGEVIVAAFSLFSTVMCVPFIAADYSPMSIWQLICLLLAGSSAALGQMCITAAYTYAPPREISVYDYAQVLYAAALGFIVWREMPDVWSFAGYAIIIAAAVFRWNMHRKNN